MADTRPLDVAAPDTLQVLDLLGSDADAELWLALRDRLDDDRSPMTMVALRAEERRLPGESVRVVGRAGTVAATLVTVHGEHGRGGTMTSVSAADDPGEPVLGDLVAFAVSRARANGVDQVDVNGRESSTVFRVLRERHGFVEYQRWIAFSADTAPQATPAKAATPPGLDVVTLADRPDLMEAAYHLELEIMADAAGDFPRIDPGLARWVERLQESPTSGPELVLLLVDSASELLGMVSIDHEVQGSERGWISYLGVARAHRGRGYAHVLKHASLAAARGDGITELRSNTESSNAGTIHLNRAGGWVEQEPVISAKRVVSPGASADAALRRRSGPRGR